MSREYYQRVVLTALGFRGVGAGRGIFLHCVDPGVSWCCPSGRSLQLTPPPLLKVFSWHGTETREQQSSVTISAILQLSFNRLLLFKWKQIIQFQFKSIITQKTTQPTVILLLPFLRSALLIPSLLNSQNITFFSFRVYVCVQPYFTRATTLHCDVFLRPELSRPQIHIPKYQFGTKWKIAPTPYQWDSTLYGKRHVGTIIYLPSFKFLVFVF